MPSKYLRKGPNKLKKCSERRTNSCSDETDGCCGLITCSYCLEFETYDGIERGIATFPDGGTAWTGAIAGASFLAYWERGYVSGECEFVVMLDDVEIYRKSCYEGQSCRDSSDEASATIGYDTGTLRWTKYESRPLKTVQDPETGCRVHFCGQCHCTTRCLCVAVNTAVIPGYGSTQHAGEICDTSYSDCDPPNWVGTVGGLAIDLALAADEYDGSCIIHGTIGGEDVSVSLSLDCSTIDETITLSDGATVRLTSKICSCAEDGPGICFCDRSFGDSPTIRFVSNNDPGTVHTVELSYSSSIGDGLTCTPINPCQGYIGRFCGTLAIPMGGSRSDCIDFRVVCSTECSGYCLYYRFDSAADFGSTAWCKFSSPMLDCECPATAVYSSLDIISNPCVPDPYSYQIPEFVFEEDPSNCA